MPIEKIIVDYLSHPEYRPSELTPQQIGIKLEKYKRNAVMRSDELAAKEAWCFEKALDIQELYIRAFSALQRGSFYDGWCLLEQVGISLGQVEAHAGRFWHLFKLGFISVHVERWQSLFPYKVFFSPEIIEVEKRCSICNLIVRPRTGCTHRLREIYEGEMCFHIITKMQALGVGMVSNPVQKYSVAFISGKNGESIDQYDYTPIKYALKISDSLFPDWTVKRSVRLQPHARFSHVGRNERCPCGQDKKYKKCCLLKAGVAQPHLEFRVSGNRQSLPPKDEWHAIVPSIR
jgi:hypothetical protein